MFPWQLETLKEVWNNDTGECIELGPDRDGLELVELRFRSGPPTHEITQRFSMPPALALRFYSALGRWLRGELKCGPRGTSHAASVILDERSGEAFEIGPHRSDGDLLEFSARTREGRVAASVAVEQDAAVLVHQALGELLGVVPTAVDVLSADRSEA